MEIAMATRVQEILRTGCSGAIAANERGTPIVLASGSSDPFGTGQALRRRAVEIGTVFHQTQQLLARRHRAPERVDFLSRP